MTVPPTWAGAALAQGRCDVAAALRDRREPHRPDALGRISPAIRDGYMTGGEREGADEALR